MDTSDVYFIGGPLGELVQWSDIISALYIMGHELTITSEVEQLSAYVFFNVWIYSVAMS